MSRLLVLVVVSGVVVAGGLAPAYAGPFGGFSADQSHYLEGRDRVCTPIAVTGSTSRAAPSCEQADTGRVAALQFRRGRLQQGARAEYEASARGTEITITRRRDRQPVMVWSALDPIARIAGVYLSESGTIMAVEYESRFGGRVRTDTVAFVLPGAGSGAGAGGAAPDARPAPGEAAEGSGSGTSGSTRESPVDGGGGHGAGPPASGAALDEQRARALAAELEAARRLDAKGAARLAAEAYGKVLATDPSQLEARYGLARNLARQGKGDAALDALRALAGSGHPDAVVWLVEARFDRAFARLRAHAGFRAATGLDGDPDRPRALYERLLGFSNTWEQPEIKCEQAQVALTLERLARTFRLRIVSRCGSFQDATRLAGRWRLGDPGLLELLFPNPQGPEETLRCRMDTCARGEDCLRCGEGTDLAFTLRPVRR